MASHCAQIPGLVGFFAGTYGRLHPRALIKVTPGEGIEVRGDISFICKVIFFFFKGE